jgi:hypothetical protein
MSGSEHPRELPMRLHHIFGGRPLSHEALEKQFAGMGMTVVGSSPEKLAELIRTETVKLKAVATSSGITS